MQKGTAKAIVSFRNVLTSDSIGEWSMQNIYIIQEERRVDHKYWDSDFLGFDTREGIFINDTAPLVQFVPLEGMICITMIWQSTAYDDLRQVRSVILEDLGQLKTLEI